MLNVWRVCTDLMKNTSNLKYIRNRKYLILSCAKHKLFFLDVSVDRDGAKCGSSALPPLPPDASAAAVYMQSTDPAMIPAALNYA